MHAANVAHYVNIDGQTAASPPGGVPTLALWAGRGTPGRTIGGATNVTIPNATHVQTATSPQSFAQMFKFFTGHRPRTTNIVSQQDRITISGRALLFPQNVGVPAGTTLTIWRVSTATGQRIGKHPVATPTLASDGSWGPVSIQSGKHYEFALSQSGEVEHFYREPFRRSDHLVRLLTQVPHTGLDALSSKSPQHANLIVIRYKELWGDQGSQNDILEINGVNVINAATSPLRHLTNAMFAFDEGNDEVSNVSAPIPTFFAIPFLSGGRPVHPGGVTSDRDGVGVAQVQGSRAGSHGELPEFPIDDRFGQRAVQRLRALARRDEDSQQPPALARADTTLRPCERISGQDPPRAVARWCRRASSRPRQPGARPRSRTSPASGRIRCGL